MQTTLVYNVAKYVPELSWPEMDFDLDTKIVKPDRYSNWPCWNLSQPSTYEFEIIN
jgi:hypothetical protein